MQIVIVVFVLIGMVIAVVKLLSRAARLRLAPR